MRTITEDDAVSAPAVKADPIDVSDDPQFHIQQPGSRKLALMIAAAVLLGMAALAVVLG